MRPTANFTFHAILAAALAALATSSAAAGDALKLLATTGPIKAGDGKHIDVLSYSFGVSENRAKGKVEHEWKVEEGESAPPPRGGVRVAAGDLDGDGRADISAKQDVKSPRDASAGLPTGKRQHKPVTITKEWDSSSPAAVTEKRQHGWVTVSKPVEQGSLRLKGSLPGCAVGATYPQAVLQTAAARYELTEVIISSCAADSVSLDYAKVKVRGWDPTKKEE